MKTVILVLHMVSGATLEITDAKDVKALKGRTESSCHPFRNLWPYWLHEPNNREFCCSINGCVTHINTGNIEYIEEKEIEK